jgi:hypothetical protein
LIAIASKAMMLSTKNRNSWRNLRAKSSIKL